MVVLRWLLVLTAGCGRWGFDYGDAGSAAGDAGGSAAALCTTHWCWDNPPPPAQRSLRAISGTSATDVWAVGDGGVIQHWDGAAWSIVTSPTNDGLDAVWAIAPGDVRVAAREGVIWRYHSGGLWSSTTVPSKSTVAALWREPGGALWEASDIGAIAVDETSIASVPTRAAATALHGTSASNVWHTGAFNSVSRWNGSAWAQMLIADFPVAIWATATGAWTAGNQLWTCTPALSCTVSLATAPIRGFWGSSDTDIWGGGYGGKLYHLQNTWSEVTSPTSVTLNALWGTSASDIWAVGDAGVILHYDGAAWTPVTAPSAPPLEWRALAVIADDDRWLGDSNGGLWHFDGTTLTRAITPGSSAIGDEIEGIAANNVYAADTANGTVLHWDGTSWGSESLVMPGPAALAVSSLGEVLAGSKTNQQVWSRTPPGVWTMRYTGGVEWHGACFPDDGVRALAVGRFGTAVTRNIAGTWMAVPPPTGRFLLACTFVPRTGSEAWAVGGDALEHFKSDLWTDVINNASTHALLDVLAVSATEIFIVGDTGALVAGDGVTWQEEASPVSTVLDRLAVSPTGTVYAVGGAGVMLHRQ